MITFPLLSTACFPPISYLAVIAKSAGAFIDPFENYSKQSFRNRYEIYGPNGRQTLSIPIIKQSGQKTMLRDTKIEFVSDWKKVHLRSLEAAYANTPFFEYYFPEVKDMILCHKEYLIEYNRLILSELQKLFKLNTEIRFTEKYIETGSASLDYREAFHPKHQRRKPLIRFNQESYYQIFSDKYGFMEDLSCLDLLFHMGPEAENYLLHQCNF